MQAHRVTRRKPARVREVERYRNLCRHPGFGLRDLGTMIRDSGSRFWVQGLERHRKLFSGIRNTLWGLGFDLNPYLESVELLRGTDEGLWINPPVHQYVTLSNTRGREGRRGQHCLGRVRLKDPEFGITVSGVGFRDQGLGCKI